jgi:RimJ/RimL family protein N-acetyltransferase
VSFEFVTERLRIRPWRAADRPALERMVRDPDMMRYVTLGPDLVGRGDRRD